VSGGADSGAALLLAREAMPDAVLHAVYVDHGLRPRAAIERDIAAARAQARHAGASVIVRKVRVPRRGVSLEAAARAERYRALIRAARELGAPVIITGHHRDDVVETVLLALVRGSGLDGLAAMRAQRQLAPGITLLRPLLQYGKAQLREFVRAAGVDVAEDETNADLRLRRNAVRALVRELERVVPGASGSIARSATLLADDRALLESLAAGAYQRAALAEPMERSSRSDKSDRSKRVQLLTRELRELPPALLRRTIRHAVKRQLGSLRDFHLAHCDAVVRAIQEGRGGTFHAGRGLIELSAGRLSVIGPAASQRSSGPRRAESEITVPARRALASDARGEVTLRHVSVKAAHADALLLDALPPGTRLTLRVPRAGDKCIPSGRRTPLPLARFLAKSGVPKHRRAEAIVLCRDEEIVAVVGIRVMEPYVARSTSALELRVQRG
jgi:tRNA(Ile)-lysidine synthase